MAYRAATVGTMAAAGGIRSHRVRPSGRDGHKAALPYDIQHELKAHDNAGRRF